MSFNIFIPIAILVAYVCLCRAELSVAEYCDCIQFNRTSCFCGMREDNSGALIYCDGGRESTQFPSLKNPNPSTCRLAADKCDVAIVFEHYRLSTIPGRIFKDLFAQQACRVRFAHRHNPELREIDSEAFAIDGAGNLKELHISHTGLESLDSIPPVLQNTNFSCDDSGTVVSLANNKISDWLRPALRRSLRCVNSFSLNHNPQIFLALVALNEVRLSQLGLANTSIQQISAFDLRGSQITNLDLSLNPKLSIDNYATETSVQVEKLKLSTSTKMSNPSLKNDSLAPKKLLACITANSLFHCANVTETHKEKSLSGILGDCDATENVCNHDSFNISEGVIAPNRFKELLQRGYAFPCAGNPSSTLNWYLINTDSYVEPIKQDTSNKYKYVS